MERVEHTSGDKTGFQERDRWLGSEFGEQVLTIANGESIIANQRGTIRIKIASDPRWDLPDIPIMLTDVIYAPKLKSNLLSVGRMTNSNVNVYFGRHLSWLSLNGKVIAYRLKDNNLLRWTPNSAQG
jgi:hypothetical protein